MAKLGSRAKLGGSRASGDAARAGGETLYMDSSKRAFAGTRLATFAIHVRMCARRCGLLLSVYDIHLCADAANSTGAGSHAAAVPFKPPGCRATHAARACSCAVGGPQAAPLTCGCACPRRRRAGARRRWVSTRWPPGCRRRPASGSPACSEQGGRVTKHLRATGLLRTTGEMGCAPRPTNTMLYARRAGRRRGASSAPHTSRTQRTHRQLCAVDHELEEEGSLQEAPRGKARLPHLRAWLERRAKETFLGEGWGEGHCMPTGMARCRCQSGQAGAGVPWRARLQPRGRRCVPTPHPTAPHPHPQTPKTSPACAGRPAQPGWWC